MQSVLGRSGNWKDFLKTSPVTSVLIILNTVVLLMQMATGGFFGTVSSLGVINPRIIIEYNEWYRIVSAGFIHFSLMHFIGNIVIGIFAFSSALERTIGSKKFAFIYFGSMIFSGIMITFLGEYTHSTAGASGAIFGVMGSLLYLAFFRKDIMSSQDMKTIGSLLVVNLIFTFMIPNISILGHVGGIIGGFLLSYLVIRRNVFKVYN